MNLDSSEKRKPITFNDTIPLVSLYWVRRLARSNGTPIPDHIAKIMENTPGYAQYMETRDTARVSRDAKIRNNPQNSHA